MKIKIITPQHGNAVIWSAALRERDQGFDVCTELRPLHTVNVLVNGSRPDLVVVETTTPGDFDALQRLATAHPELEYVLVGSGLTPEILMDAMRAGVREVLPAPATPDAVCAAVQRLARKRMPAAAPSSHSGEVIGFVSCKGGSGATFVAANVAHMLAAGGQRSVALIDLNLQFGDAALFVTSEPPVSNVADVARNIQRLDSELLRSAMSPVGTGLWVLGAPEDPGLASDVKPQHVHAIVALARTMFDIVVLDLGRSLNAVTLDALDASDHLYAVLQLTLPFIRDGRRLRDVFRTLDYPASKVHWVVNRYQKGGEISLEDLKRTLDVGELLTIPNQYEVVASSVNQGIPVERLAPSSAVARALRDLATTIVPSSGKRPGAGWLSGLWRSGTPRTTA